MNTKRPRYDYKHIKQIKQYLEAAYIYDLELGTLRKTPLEPASKDEVLKYYKEFLDNPRTMLYHIDWLGEYAGFLIISEFPKEFGPEFAREHKGFHIEESFVYPKYRRKGLMGTTLYRVIEEYKDKEGCMPEITYFVLKQNKGAIAFWEKQFLKRYVETNIFASYYNMDEFYLKIAVPK